MHLFVTGATGFLGRSFAIAARERGHDVGTLVRRRAPFLEQRGLQPVIKDLMTLGISDFPAAVDAVVHFATGTNGDDRRVIEVAVEGTRRLLQLAHEARVPRFVHVSSMSVYPGPVGRDPARLDGLTLDQHPERRGIYARSKALADAALQELASGGSLGDMELVILRPGLVFGTGMKSALAGTAVELPLGLRIGLGRPTQSVPLVELGDLTEGLLMLLERSPAPGTIQIYNVLSGPPPTKSELLRLYGEVAGRDGRTIWVPETIAVLAASIIDQFRSTQLAYNVRRMYRFESRDLPYSSWRAPGTMPRASARAAVVAALTIDQAGTGSIRSSEDVCRTAGELKRTATEPAPSVNETVPLILVGAGRIVTEMHVPALQALPQFQVRAVVDPDRALAEQAAAHFPGAATVERIGHLGNELLSGATAVLAAPGFLHGSLASELLERGASVMVEKPAALLRHEFDELYRLEREHGVPVSVFHNYRLRPRVLDLWCFLLRHDVGGLVKARLTFHSPRIDLERARWMHDEKRNRTLVMDLAIHFIDLACLIGGRVAGLEHVRVVDRLDGRSTISMTGLARLDRCNEFFFDLDLSGTAPRTELVLQFERATCVLDFFPDGFRVLPRKPNPLDELVADARRLTDALTQKLRPVQNGMPKRAVPHHRIYLEHLRRLSGASTASPFSLAGVHDTMESLFVLADAAYAGSSVATDAR